MSKKIKHVYPAPVPGQIDSFEDGDEIWIRKNDSGRWVNEEVEKQLQKLKLKRAPGAGSPFNLEPSPGTRFCEGRFKGRLPGLMKVNPRQSYVAGASHHPRSYLPKSLLQAVVDAVVEA
jgi:hypothetical protein